ncbi:MAG: hypothetical protein FJX74_07710 [Armatimonadetes bacterium]|nr:hypothetical protein [Armatimonadota bacterium]
MGLLVALTVFTCTPAWPETYRFDMGSETSPVAEGYVRVTPGTLLAANPAFGWTQPPRMIVWRNDPANPYFAVQDTGPEFALYSDGVLSIEENTFVFLVRPGRYAVTAVIGDLALGEWRPGNSIWANGAQVAGNESTGGTVKAFGFPVEAAEGRIELRFRADSVQQYVTVIAVTAEPLAEGEACPVTVTEHPPAPMAAEDYRRNWERYVALLLTDWETAKAELRGEGVDPEGWLVRNRALKLDPDYREYFGFGLGSGSWERLAEKAGGIDLSGACAAFVEMGVDGFTTGSPLAVRELPIAGLKHAVAVGGEGFPRPEIPAAARNLLQGPDGALSTRDGVWSNCASEAVEAFREYWTTAAKDVLEAASFLVIDEPRGMWYSGTFGDHSAAAQEAFRRWAAEQGHTDLAQRGIPPRGRTLDFYRFYQFRLDSVPRFVRAVAQGTPLEPVPLMPGNGNVGPEQMNHNGYWPPAVARHGMISASWAYDSPASCKMYAETVRMAGEFGGRSCIVPPLYPEQQTPVQALPMHTACLSALSDTTCPWHFRGPTDGPDRAAWMKTVFLSARLAHGLTGLQHTPPLYVWCPESIVYSDLVDLTRAEAEHWTKTWQCLFDANLDYAVTNTLDLPEGSTVLWSCARPVLNEEEWGRLEGFIERGGRLVCTFTATPEDPAGAPLPRWEGMKERVTYAELAPEAIASLGGPRNWETGEPAIKTYLYRRGGTTVHLLNNTDLTQPATVQLPFRVEDLYTGERRERGAAITVRSGRYALLEERAR